jgi:hypothetical protein
VTDIKLSAGDNRADRTGSEPAPRLPRRGAVVSRHGAISRELTKYSNYKSWAEKVRGAFAADADEKPGVNGSGTRRRSTDR